MTEESLWNSLRSRNKAVGHFVQLEGHDTIVAGEVPVNGKNLPVAAEGDGANQKADVRSGDTLGSTMVVDAGGLFVVCDFESWLVES